MYWWCTLSLNDEQNRYTKQTRFPLMEVSSRKTFLSSCEVNYRQKQKTEKLHVPERSYMFSRIIYYFRSVSLRICLILQLPPVSRSLKFRIVGPSSLYWWKPHPAVDQDQYEGLTWAMSQVFWITSVCWGSTRGPHGHMSRHFTLHSTKLTNSWSGSDNMLLSATVRKLVPSQSKLTGLNMAKGYSNAQIQGSKGHWYTNLPGVYIG